MFKISEIKELIKLIDQSSLHELEIENEGTRLVIRKPNKTESVIVTSAAPQYSLPSAAPQQLVQAAAAPVHAISAGSNEEEPARAEVSNLHTIVSPMVGTFYHAPSPDVPPFVSVGSKVSGKTVVCIVEAMKLMNEIEAEIKGEIVEILADNGQLVEYGQPLFLVKPE